MTKIIVTLDQFDLKSACHGGSQNKVVFNLQITIKKP
jgi:hypothetical protein